MFYLYKVFGVDKFIEIESKVVFVRGWEEGLWGVSINEYRIFFWGNENYLELDSGDVCKIFWIY